jgi:hypothetical protein
MAEVGRMFPALREISTSVHWILAGNKTLLVKADHNKTRVVNNNSPNKDLDRIKTPDNKTPLNNKGPGNNRTSDNNNRTPGNNRITYNKTPDNNKDPDKIHCLTVLVVVVLVVAVGVVVVRTDQQTMNFVWVFVVVWCFVVCYSVVAWCSVVVV